MAVFLGRSGDGPAQPLRMGPMSCRRNGRQPWVLWVLLVPSSCRSTVGCRTHRGIERCHAVGTHGFRHSPAAGNAAAAVRRRPASTSQSNGADARSMFLQAQRGQSPFRRRRLSSVRSRCACGRMPDSTKKNRRRASAAV